MELKHVIDDLADGRDVAFNRTFMELKHGFNKYFGMVTAGTFNRTFMELKPVMKAMNGQDGFAFNRTFMELKLERIDKKANVIDAFNRTFWELKIKLSDEHQLCTIARF